MLVEHRAVRAKNQAPRLVTREPVLGVVQRALRDLAEASASPTSRAS